MDGDLVVTAGLSHTDEIDPWPATAATAAAVWLTLPEVSNSAVWIVLSASCVDTTTDEGIELEEFVKLFCG
jgi:hypothetical protein